MLHIIFSKNFKELDSIINKLSLLIINITFSVARSSHKLSTERSNEEHI